MTKAGFASVFLFDFKNIVFARSESMIEENLICTILRYPFVDEDLKFFLWTPLVLIYNNLKRARTPKHVF